MNLRTADIVKGAIGGLLGAFVMRSALNGWHAQTNFQVQHGAFGLDREADVNSIQLLASRLFKKQITDDEAFRIATQFHYAYGALGGVAYATVAGRLPTVGPTYPVVFALLVWLIGDEIPIAVLGISDPFKKSIYSHLAALTGHLLYAASIEAACGVSAAFGQGRSRQRTRF